MESSSCVDKWRMRAFCQEGFFVSRHVTLASSVKHGVKHGGRIRIVRAVGAM